MCIYWSHVTWVLFTVQTQMHAYASINRMHVHTPPLYVPWNKSKLCNVFCHWQTDVSVYVRHCVSMIAPLWWQIADRQRVQQQVMGRGGSSLISSLPLSSYRSPPPSYLAPAKTHSSVLTQAYYTSFLPSQHNKEENEAAAGRWNLLKCVQNKCFHQKFHSLICRECWLVCFAFRPNSQDNSFTWKNTQNHSW